MLTKVLWAATQLVQGMRAGFSEALNPEPRFIGVEQLGYTRRAGGPAIYPFRDMTRGGWVECACKAFCVLHHSLTEEFRSTLHANTQSYELSYAVSFYDENRTLINAVHLTRVIDQLLAAATDFYSDEVFNQTYWEPLPNGEVRLRFIRTTVKDLGFAHRVHSNLLN